MNTGAGAATPTRTRLSPEQIAQRMPGVPQWSEVNGAIQRTWQFRGFVDSIAFVTRVAFAAEKADHHPDILVRWNKVTLTLNTHDAGGITETDFALASVFDSLA